MSSTGFFCKQIQAKVLIQVMLDEKQFSEVFNFPNQTIGSNIFSDSSTLERVLVSGSHVWL